MKLKLIIILSLFSFLFSATPAQAKKKLTRSTGVQPTTQSYGVWDKLKLRGDHQAILLVLGGLKYAKEVSYNLTYTSNLIPQGVEGSHDVSLGNTQTELTFGTCSGNDCNYHQNIKDMFMEINYSLQSGKTLTKKYQINL